MLQAISRAAPLACALFLSLSALAQQPTTPSRESGLLRLRYATFDPTASEPAIVSSLRDRGQLWIVQFTGTPGPRDRSGVAECGGRVHGYLPDNAYIVRMPAAAAQATRQLPTVRWVGRYHAAYRLHDRLLAELLGDGIADVRRYNLVVADKHTDKPALAANIAAIGGTVVSEETGGLLFSALLSGEQLVRAAAFDEVLWIDQWSPPENDMDNARIQGGGNYVEAQGGFTGSGLGAHIYEGIEATHPAFSGPVTNVLSGGQSDSHGTNTAGIVFGDGTGNPQFRGMAPDVAKFYTNYSSVTTSRWQVISDLVNVHGVSHTTASWGPYRTRTYDSVSAEADDIIFDHDICWTQSQSNAGNQDSRPQAWAKNIFSIGGFYHYNNSNPLDDSWNGGGSTGPAADGRIKPTLAAYYDAIGTTAVGGGYTTSFGGTSGATPIVAGHNLLVIDMFTDDSATPGVGPFGNALRSPGAGKHANRPHFTTVKALQVASAYRYPFSPTNTDNSRMHVGWGFPDLQRMWDDRGKTYIVDETDVLAPGAASRFDVTVATGEPSLRVVLHYAEPAAVPSATKTLINDLTVRVTAPDFTVYWGNQGLEQGNWSVAGGAADDTNPIECVFVQNPLPGVWHVDVVATAVVADNHVETAAMDADYGLVIVGGPTVPGTAPVFASFTNSGQGCPGSVMTSPTCASLNPAGGSLSNNTNTYEYCYAVANTGSAEVTGFEIFTSSNSGTITRPAHIYLPAGSGPATSPLASTTITVGTTPGFYSATFANPVTVTGPYYIGYENSPGGVISNLTSGATGTGYYRTAVTGTWGQSSLVQHPSYRVICSPVALTPALAGVGLPILGGTYDVTLAGALASSAAFLITGFSDTIFLSTPLPAPLPNAPGCEVFASPELTILLPVSAAGTSSFAVTLPNLSSLIGVPLYHQWAVIDGATALGVVVSDAGRATIGN